MFGFRVSSKVGAALKHAATAAARPLVPGVSSAASAVSAMAVMGPALPMVSAAPMRSLFLSAASPALASSMSATKSFAATTTSSSAAAAPVFAAIPARSYLNLVAPGPITLGTLRDIPGASKVAKRYGRGRGSGIGKTCGRGQKGQKARSGLRSQVRFEGGQTMLWRRSPKRGFKNVNRQELNAVNVGAVVKMVSAGRIDASKTITTRVLRDVGLAKSIRHGVKLTGGDAALVARLPVPLTFEVAHASAVAKAAVVAMGGSVTFQHMSRLALHSHLFPGTRRFVPAPSVAPPKKQLRYTHQLCGKADEAKAQEIRLARIVRKLRQK